MAFFNADDGRFSFEDGTCLEQGAPAHQLNERYQNPTRNDLTLCLPAYPVRGGSLAVI